MASYAANDPAYFSISPADLKYAQIGAEAMGYRNAIFRMGPDDDKDAPAVVMLYLPPGGVLPRHSHACYRLEVVVQGSMQAEDGAWLHPGDVRTSAPGEPYGPHTAGPQGVLSVEVFSSGVGVDASFADDLPADHQASLARAAVAVEAWMKGTKSCNGSA